MKKLQLVMHKIIGVPLFYGIRQAKNHYMILRKQIYIIGCVAALFCFAVFNSTSETLSFSHLKLNAEKVPWTELSFHVKNFWVEVATTVQLKSLPVSDIEALLLTSPKGTPIRPSKPQAFQMTINRIIEPAFQSPVAVHNQIWFNPSDAAALGRIRLRRGEDDFKKTYRFTEQGVFRHRIEPKDKKEASLEPEKWTDTKDSFYPYDLTRLGCSSVSERSLLIYVLSAAPIAKINGPVSLCVFDKRQLHRVQLRKEGTLPIYINYIEKSQQGETRKEGTVKALKVAITAQPIEPNREDTENFSFLGFHKDIFIYIEPTSGLPIQASGIIPTIGKAQLMLNEVKWAFKPE